MTFGEGVPTHILLILPAHAVQHSHSLHFRSDAPWSGSHPPFADPLPLSIPLSAKRKYPLFDADKIVLNLYKNKNFVNLLIKKFKLKNRKNIKKQIRELIKENRAKNAE